MSNLKSQRLQNQHIEYPHMANPENVLAHFGAI